MRLIFSLGIIFSALIIDLSSKWFIEAHVMTPPRVIPVVPSFNLVLGYNRGVSFGLFNSDSPYVPYALTAVALAIIIVLAVALWRSNSLAHTIGFAAIIGGALSNVVDRLGDGAVTDFLDFYVGQYHWPAFNFADTLVFCGTLILLISYSRAPPAVRA